MSKRQTNLICQMIPVRTNAASLPISEDGLGPPTTLTTAQKLALLRETKKKALAAVARKVAIDDAKKEALARKQAEERRGEVCFKI